MVVQMWHRIQCIFSSSQWVRLSIGRVIAMVDGSSHQGKEGRVRYIVNRFEKVIVRVTADKSTMPPLPWR